MAREKQAKTDVLQALARSLTTALQRERIIPRFVDSYVVEHGRQALQVHPTMYRDLLALLQREALLAMSMRAIEIASNEPEPKGKSKAGHAPRKDSAAFRRKFLTALAREHQWSAGDALDFQSDLRRYEDLLAGSVSNRRSRKPFEAASHPFVDRCAFLLDSSFMEKARLAASRALTELENLTAQIIASTGKPAALPRSRATH